MTENLRNRYLQTRNRSLQLAADFSPEDCMISATPDASPLKWHLAHTSWFFENFILVQLFEREAFSAEHHYLFNSYYKAEGAHLHRSMRSIISRPGLSEIYRYREHVDREISRLLETEIDTATSFELKRRIIIGIEHEQQHQELMLTDIKRNLFANPMVPALSNKKIESEQVPALEWLQFPEGIYQAGTGSPENNIDFSFDNERPRHNVFLAAFQIANRPVCNAEFLRFIENGGYQNAAWWLSDAWDLITREKIHNPLYWQMKNGKWYEYRADGLRLLDENKPAVHISFYEAEAYARFANCRLPSEFEWETAMASVHSLNTLNFEQPVHPSYARSSNSEIYLGGVWEWTSSAYLPYPGFQAEAGSLGEYNGKFMNNQRVLRGGSCATPENHARLTYRNFFPGEAGWQFSGIRLAKDIK